VGDCFKGKDKPRAVVVNAIIISSVVVGLGLTAGPALAVNFTLAIVGYIVVANSLSVYAGYLYWKRGLEAQYRAYVWLTSSS